MSWKLRYAIITMFVLLMIVLSIGLPSGLFALQDKNIIGKVNLEEQNMVTVSYQQPLSTMEKIKLIGDTSLKSLALDQGKYNNRQSIQTVALNEISTLKTIGILPGIGGEINFYECTPQLYITTEQPSKSLILWNIRFNNENGYGTLAIDDETGKVLMFMVSKLIDVPLYELSEAKAQVWGKYLGFTVKESVIKPVLKYSDYKNVFQLVTYQQKKDTLTFTIIKDGPGYNFGFPLDQNEVDR